MSIIFITSNYIIILVKYINNALYTYNMKRKINRVGQNTLTVSLPSKWARKMGLFPGQEIDMIEDNDSLILGSKPTVKKSKVTIDVTDLESMINRTMAATYKSGFFSVDVRYKSSKELRIVQETVDRACHIFEVMDIGSDVIKIRSISQLDPANFDNVLRKVGFSVVDMAKETLEGIKKNDLKHLETVIIKDKLVDRHTDFCRRVLNVGYEVNHNKVCPLYVLCEQSEILADIYKGLCSDLIIKKIKVEKDLQQLLKAINTMVEYFYTLIFDFSLEGVRDLGLQEVKIRNMIDKACETSRKDAKIICHLNNIFETCFEMKSALITFKLGEMAESSDNL